MVKFIYFFDFKWAITATANGLLTLNFIKMFDLSPLKENEVSNVGLANISSRSLIERHQLCIEILEGIMYFEQRKKHRIESIEGFAGTFPELRRKYVNDVDTINRCIQRLEQRYQRVLNGS